MEVNDISAITIPYHKYREVPRRGLVEALSQEDKNLLLKVFVPDMEQLLGLLRDKAVKTALILTEPLCSLPVRRRIFHDIADRFGKEYALIFKPHPRDELDYRKEFPGYPVIDRVVPMEMLNFIENCRIDLAVGVFTELGALDFADQKLKLGADFMDAYEDPSIHRFADLTGRKR